MPTFLSKDSERGIVSKFTDAIDVVEAKGWRVFAAGLLVIIAAAAWLLCGVGASQASPYKPTPGYPNVGVFTPDTVHCGGVLVPETGPELRFGGTLRAKEIIIFRVSTDSWWPEIPASMMKIKYNGDVYSASSSQFQVGGWGKPFVSKTAPTFTIAIRGLQPGQKVTFESRWASSGEWGHVADGWVNEVDCSFTTNPKPPR